VNEPSTAKYAGNAAFLVYLDVDAIAPELRCGGHAFSELPGGCHAAQKTRPIEQSRRKPGASQSRCLPRVAEAGLIRVPRVAPMIRTA